MIAQHVFVYTLAAFDFGNETASGLGELPQEAFVPHLLLVVTAARAFARADAHKDAYITAGPLVENCFVERIGGWIKGADAVVVEHGLADLDGLERQAYGRGGTTGLPDFAVKVGRWLPARVVGAKHGGC